MGMEVRKIGWEDTALLLRSIGDSIRADMTEKHVRDFAVQTKKRLVLGIWQNTFSLSPLTKKYLDRKIAAGYSSRILIRTSTYVRSINVMKAGKRGFWVGLSPSAMTAGYKVLSKSGKSYTIRNQVPMWKLAAWLEYGTSGPKRMPARPHWRPTEAWVADAWPKHMQGRINEHVRRRR